MVIFLALTTYNLDANTVFLLYVYILINIHFCPFNNLLGAENDPGYFFMSENFFLYGDSL